MNKKPSIEIYINDKENDSAHEKLKAVLVELIETAKKFKSNEHRPDHVLNNLNEVIIRAEIALKEIKK